MLSNVKFITLALFFFLDDERNVIFITFEPRIRLTWVDK